MLDALTAVHRTVARVVGELSLAIAHRAVAKGRIQVWIAAFRAAADELERLL